MRFAIPTLRITGFLLPALFLASAMAVADVPRETLERLAEIRVETAELEHFKYIQKLTREDYSLRSKALQKEAAALWEPVRRIPHGEAESTIQGLSRAKLALLEPQWEKEAQDFKKATEKRLEQTGLELEQDARRAVEFQRQRLILQQQLTSGTIDRDSFSLKDHAALTGIADLRKKYETAGGVWPERFDHRLDMFTKALADNPATVLPQSQVGEGTPDFNRDVKLAAEILIKEQENAFKFDKKQISPDTSRETAVIYNRDLGRLRERYQAISPKRGEEFQNAYTRMAEPSIHALRVKYYPGQYTPIAPAVKHALGDGRIDQTPKKPVTKPGESWWDSTTFWYFFLGVGGVMLVWLIVTRLKTPEEESAPPLSDNYGTAQWAERQLNPSGPTAVARGVMFGKSSHPDLPADAPGAPITSTPEFHTLIVSRTRGGKGTRVIVPTLLCYDRSMIVIDPKGENAAITARTRRDKLRQAVHIVNPWAYMEPLYKDLGFTTATFNPLDVLDRTDPNVVAAARTLAAIMCPITNPKDKFWEGSAASILTGVLLWITDQEGITRADDATLKETKTLARAREIVTMPNPDFQAMLTRMVNSDAFSGAIKEMVGRYVGLSSVTYDGIISNLHQNTDFLSDPRIKASTSTSSFSMAKLRDDFITIYLVIDPDRIKTDSVWMKLMMASVMQALKNRTRLQTPPHHRCMFLIDEFGNMGTIADIPRDIAFMSGHGVDFTLVVQGLNQLEEHYGKAKGTIIGNCGYKWFCAIEDLESAKYLSECLGKATVRTVGKSKSQGESGGGATAGESTTWGETGRPLFDPAEIQNLGREIAILLNPSTSPHYLRPVDYWKLPETFAHLKDTQSQFYWIPPLSYDPNPYRQAPGGAGAKEKPRPSPKTGMTDKEARQILGVKADAKTEEIRSAYKSLMMKVHPDVGGNDYFAAQLNAAKAFLLGE